MLIKKFSDTSKAFMGIVSSQACSGSTSALRWVSIGEAAAALWGWMGGEGVPAGWC